MKGLRSLLVQLAIFGIPVGLSVGIMISAERTLGWPKPWPLLGGISFLALVIGGASWWLFAVQKRESQTIDMLNDEVFGKVELKRSCWEAQLVFEPTGELITVSSFDGTSPTEMQRATFQEIARIWDKVVLQIEDSLDAYGADIVPARPRRLKYDSIGLDAGQNEWNIQFEVSRSKAQWGFSADFRGDTLEILEDLH